ncbi:MAG: hydrogenase [Deltaproteobacteria bacterium]|nr:hydrogenase [Deltaproteobacteria bacterium]
MEWFLTGILLSTFFILGASRLAACIRAAAVQGAMLSLLPIWTRDSATDLHSLAMCAGTLLIKGILIPVLLLRSIREASIRQEMEPSASRHFSLLAGGLVVVCAFSWRFPELAGPHSPLIVPTALAMLLLGFLLLVTRRKAVTQVIGFLVLENGVFLFGMTLAAEFPMMVEMGVLLDLLVGVFVMGIMIYHINRTFDHIDTTLLATPKDTE